MLVRFNAVLSSVSPVFRFCLLSTWEWCGMKRCKVPICRSDGQRGKQAFWTPKYATIKIYCSNLEFTDDTDDIQSVKKCNDLCTIILCRCSWQLPFLMDLFSEMILPGQWGRFRLAETYRFANASTLNWLCNFDLSLLYRLGTLRSTEAYLITMS